VSVLGIDLGKKRIGLAISDESERIALPAGILSSRGRAADIAAIRSLVSERGVRRVVVGLPLHMNGRPGPEAEAARAFAAALARELDLPVETLDERWSSVEAERTLRETGQSRRKRRSGAADTLAATLLLRTFLERRARAEGQTP
jgi:putative Holliday junction resolvase